MFVTLAQAKAHLYIPIIAGDPRDPDLTAKLDAAEATILDYIGRTAAGQLRVDEWIAAVPPAAPAFVLHAILLQFGELCRYRGDDLDTPKRDEYQDLLPPIVSLLRRVCDPVLQ